MCTSAMMPNAAMPISPIMKGVIHRFARVCAAMNAAFAETLARNLLCAAPGAPGVRHRRRRRHTGRELVSRYHRAPCHGDSRSSVTLGK